jgi:hypothetical protein
MAADTGIQMEAVCFLASTEKLAFLVPMLGSALIQHGYSVVLGRTAVRRSMERARKDAVRKKRSKSRGQARLVRVFFRSAGQQQRSVRRRPLLRLPKTGSEEPAAGFVRRQLSGRCRRGCCSCACYSGVRG